MPRETPAAAVAKLQKFAMKYPDAASTPSCNNIAVKSGGKAFVYLGERDDSYNVRLKLSSSLDQAGKLAAKQPDVYEVSNIGWVLVKCDSGTALPAGLLDSWIDESFHLLAPKKLVQAWGGSASGKTAKKTPKKKAAKAAKKKATKKKATKKVGREKESNPQEVGDEKAVSATVVVEAISPLQKSAQSAFQKLSGKR